MPTSTPNAHLQLLSSKTGNKWAFTALLTNHRRHLPVQNESNCVVFLSKNAFRFPSFFQSKFIPILTTMSIPPSFNRSSFRFLRRCLFRLLSIEVHSDSHDDVHSVFFQSMYIPILSTKFFPSFSDKVYTAFFGQASLDFSSLPFFESVVKLSIKT